VSRGRSGLRLAEAARDEIRAGRFQRSMAVLTGFSAVVSGIEAYVQHGRADFSDPWMWTPVWLTPPSVAAAGAALVSERAARTMLPVAATLSTADGVIGFLLHLRGIRRMPGGYGLGQYNVVMGPPVFAPLLMTSVGVLGFLAAALRPEKLPGHIALGDEPEGLPGPLERLAVQISKGRFQQGLAVTAAGFAVLSGGEAYLEHLRGSFNDPLMWAPVFVTPPMIISAVAAAFDRDAASTVLPLASMVTFGEGLLGFGLHLRGIRRMPGGFSNMRFNVTLGPPLFAPLLFTSVGLLGMLASILRRSR
jgi:hypothetical protein